MTEVLKPGKKALEKCVEVLKKGGILIYPTETSYGIGADATNGKTMENIIKLKNRPQEKKVSIAVSDTEMAKKYLEITKDVEKLVKAFMPGPITLLVKSKYGTEGFRIPDNEFVLNLIRAFGKPITATSANISGKPPLYRISEVIRAFKGKVDIIIDGGDLSERRPSTVFNVEKKEIKREGPVTLEQIMKVIK